MGTNFYLFTKNKKTMQNIFGEWGGFSLVDYPEFGYERHIGKLSCGWKPLLQISNAFRTFNELMQVIKSHDDLLIFDEYGRQFNPDEFEKHFVDHTHQERLSLKWVLKENKFDPMRRKILTLIDFDEDEADICTPFDHLEYQRTYNEAGIKHNYHDDFNENINFWRDPDYNFDWAEGDFS